VTLTRPARCWHYWRPRTRYQWKHQYRTFADTGERRRCAACRQRHIERRLAQIADTRPSLFGGRPLAETMPNTDTHGPT
jgi:hypothetical protein